MDISLEPLLLSFVAIFIVMDPFASLPPFLAGTQKCKEEEMRSLATKAVIIAGIVAAIFAFGGLEILKLLSITLSDFKIAGGIVLALLGLENVLSFSLANKKNEKEGLESVAVLIGTPLLTGPGLITTLIFLVSTYGYMAVVAALLGALFVAWLILINAVLVRKLLGAKVIMIASKVIGLLLIAMGIAYVRAGLAG